MKDGNSLFANDPLSVCVFKKCLLAFSEVEAIIYESTFCQWRARRQDFIITSFWGKNTLVGSKYEYIFWLTII